MLARHFQLAALLLYLPEQAGVLDRQHRLIRERLQEINRALWKFAGRFAPNHQSADDPIGAEQRHGQQTAESGAHQDLKNLRWLIPYIENLHGRALGYCLTNSGIANPDVPLPNRSDQRIVHPVGGAQLKCLGLIVEDVDRACFGLRELDRLGHDRGQDSLEIECRVDRLTDVAERPQLFDRFREGFGS